MDPKQVMEMFNRQPRIGSLATANANGDVNVAVFGSPMMVDENTVVMGIGNNRSLSNLRENPKAAFIVLEPGDTAMDWKGVRVYLKAAAIEIEGDLLDTMRAKIAEKAGEGAAKMIQAAIRFDVTGIRPLLAPPE